MALTSKIIPEALHEGGMVFGIIVIFALFVLVPAGSGLAFAVAVFAFFTDIRLIVPFTRLVLGSISTDNARGAAYVRLTALLLVSLILSFAVLYKALGPTAFNTVAPDGPHTLDYLYFSVVTFTTLGYGDISPLGIARGFAALEAILGFIFTPILIAAFIVVLQRRIRQRGA